MELLKKIDPAQVIVTANGQTIGEIDELLDFGGYYRIVRNGEAGKEECRFSDCISRKPCQQAKVFGEPGRRLPGLRQLNRCIDIQENHGFLRLGGC